MISRFRALLDCLIFAGLVLVALLTLSGLLGAFLPSLDLINHFHLPLFLSGSLAFAMTFVWPYRLPRLKRPAQIIILAALLASSGLIGTEAAKRLMLSEQNAQALAASNKQALKYLSFNIYLGTWDGIGLAETVRRYNPDIATLQEYAPKRFRRQPDLKRDYPYQARCGYWRRCTLAILSKHPMDEIKRFDLGPEVTRNPMHGKMLAATVRAKGSAPIRIYNVHLAWPLPIAQQKRQMQEIAAIIKRERKRYPQQVLSGDFNSTGWAFSIDQLAKDAGMSRQSHFVPTFPSPNSRLKGFLQLPAFLSLDHIMVSPPLSTGPVVRVATEIGDHWPILTDLYVPKQ